MHVAAHLHMWFHINFIYVIPHCLHVYIYAIPCNVVFAIQSNGQCTGSPIVP